MTTPLHAELTSPDQQFLKSVFDYDPLTGNLVHLHNSAYTKTFKGDPILTPRVYIPKPYFTTWCTRRVIWVWHNGAPPENTRVITINPKAQNPNRIENLTPTIIKSAIKKCPQAKTGIIGVTLHSTNPPRWKATITCPTTNRPVSLGLHDTLLEAAYHRFAAEQCTNHPVFNHNHSSLTFPGSAGYYIFAHRDPGTTGPRTQFELDPDHNYRYCERLRDPEP